MLLMDVNILVHAFRTDMPEHIRFRHWLLEVLNGPSAYGISDYVLSSFLRIVTNGKVFQQPSSLADAWAFVQALREPDTCRIIRPGDRHWEIFGDLCRRAAAKGNLVPDAWLAALAIEAGCEWITTDRDFARFPGLRWRHPFPS